MQRNQHKQMKNDRRLKWLILVVVLFLLVLFGLFLMSPFNKKEEQSKRTVSISTSTSSTMTESSTGTSTENDEQNNRFDYAVPFTNENRYSGNYGTLSFHLLPTETEGTIRIEYDSPNFSDTQYAILTATTIPTKTVKVNEHSTVKNVKINTELKLATITNAATKDFFYPFNGDDTRVYAYYMNNGSIALAFQPREDMDQYQVIEFVKTT